jgi:hypothetical protein
MPNRNKYIAIDNIVKNWICRVFSDLQPRDWERQFASPVVAFPGKEKASGVTEAPRRLQRNGGL